MELQQQPISQQNCGNPSAVHSVFRSRLKSDRWLCRRLRGRRRWYQPVHPLLSPLAPGEQLVLLPPEWAPCQETKTVRQMRTKEKPYSTEIVQAVHAAIVLLSANTRVIVFPSRDWCDEVNICSHDQLTLHLLCNRLRSRSFDAKTDLLKQHNIK